MGGVGPPPPARQSTVLVTGAAGTLGTALVGRLVDSGWHVFAADLPGSGVEEMAGNSVTPVSVDLTEPSSVRAMAETVTATTDGLDGVVNAAATIDVGPLVEVPEKVVEGMLAVNVMGAVRVTQSLFPLVLGRRGRIVNISSDTGNRPPAPFNGAYSLSKHALEAYTHGLRRELALLGIRVVMVRPGPFGSSGRVGARYRAAAERSTHFAEALRRLGGREAPRGATEHGVAVRDTSRPDPRTDAVARLVETALTSPRPRTVYTVGTRGKRAAVEMLPMRLADAVYRHRLSS